MKVLDDLMYQSGLTADGSFFSMDQYDQEAILKYRDLIVEECARWLRNREFASPEALIQHFYSKE